MERFFEHGNECMVDGHVIFPADLNKENLQKFTFSILDTFDFFHKENLEVQVRSCFDGKGIEWQIKTFYLEKEFCLDKTYTFFLLPHWTINSIYEHWQTDDDASRCQPVRIPEKDERDIKAKTEFFLNNLITYYQKVGKVTAYNTFLNGVNWKLIYAKSIQQEQIKTSERRIQEYFKFITKSTRILTRGETKNDHQQK